jgi:hypothetical protein
MNDSDIENSLQKKTLDNENNLNLEDYKDIYENQKFQTKLNFFENSVDSTIGKKSEKKIIENVNEINLRKPKITSNNNLEKLNNFYDKYKKKNVDIENEDNNYNDNYSDIKDNINLKEEIENDYDYEVNINNNIRDNKDYINEIMNSNSNLNLNSNNKQELFDNDNSHISNLLGKN